MNVNTMLNQYNIIYNRLAFLFALLQLQMEDTPETLVAVLLDEKEMCKKLQHLKSAAEIIDASECLLPCAAEYHWDLKFNAYFNEFIDTDLTEKVEVLDKFQVLFKSIKKSGSHALVCNFPFQ